jgi:hypothetical protein
MRRIVLVLLLVSGSNIPAMARAQTATELTPDQKGYIAYDRCMMHAAIAASRTDAKDEEIFGLARAQCASIRSNAISGQEGNREFLSALDAADADKAARFPAWIKGVRERRRQFDAKTAVLAPAEDK